MKRFHEQRRKQHKRHCRAYLEHAGGQAGKRKPHGNNKHAEGEACVGDEDDHLVSGKHRHDAATQLLGFRRKLGSETCTRAKKAKIRQTLQCFKELGGQTCRSSAVTPRNRCKCLLESTHHDRN